METTEIIITHEGLVKRRCISEVDLDCGDTVIQSLSREVTRKAKNVFGLPNWGTCHLAMDGEHNYVTLRIARLPIRAPYKKIGDLVVPVFSSKADPVLPLSWTPPGDMILTCLFQTRPEETATFLDKMWLFAYDPRGEAWRLPLGNLFDDCAVCTGKSAEGSDIWSHPTVLGLVESLMTQFENSKWNADLWQTAAQTQKMFRFKPTADGFEQAPIDAKTWQSLCQKVSIAAMQKVIL